MTVITLEVPIATAFRLNKLGDEELRQFFIKKYLTVDSNLCYFIVVLREEKTMPNMPRCDLRQVIFRFEIETVVQLKKYAQSQGRTVNDVVRAIIEDLVKDVELTEQDYLDIAAEVANNVAKRNKS